MSSGTKVALVALMVLMMVVIARLVNDETDEPEVNSNGGVATTRDPKDGSPESGGAGQKAPARSSSAKNALPGAGVTNSRVTSANPSTRSAPPRTPATRAGSATGNSASSTLGATTVLRTSPSARAARSGSRSPTASGGTMNDPAALRQLAAGAGPISGAPGSATPGAEGSPSTTSRAGGLTSSRSVEPPLSVERKAATPPELARRTPVVDTRLGSGTASGATQPTGRAGAPTGSTLGTSTLGTSTLGTSTLGTSSRSGTRGSDGRTLAGASTTGSVPLKSYGGTTRTTPSSSEADAVSSGTVSFPMSYTIQPNDSLWKIAEKYYGRGHLYKQIASHNPGVKIQPGRTLIIPAPAPASSSSRATSTTLRSANVPSGSARSTGQGRTHVVQKGETLWEIAGRAYGDPLLWTRIKEANPNLKSGDKIKAGMKILIP